MSAGNRRDEQLRKSLLDEARRLGNAAAGRWVSVSKLAIAARDSLGGGVDSETHALNLVRDLLGWGLLEEKASQPLPGGPAAGTTVPGPDLRYLQVRLSDLGWQLWSGQIDPIPGVADRRLES